MSFRNSSIDEVIILEGCKKEELAEEIIKISDKHVIVDLQYAVSDKKLFRPFKHHVLLLIQRKN